MNGKQSETLRVLIVDDDEFAAKVHAKLLENAGYDVSVETTSEDVLTRVQSERPGLVLLDLMMPGVHGLEICRSMRADKTFDDIRIIFVSAKSYEFDQKRAIEFGADGYFVKPVSPDAFLDGIERIIEDRVDLAFWGVRGTLPVPGKSALRYGGNTVCMSLEFPKGELFIFDAGTGIKALGDHLTASGRTRLEASVFISHPHWDHINALPFFAPLYIPGNALEICGATHGDVGMRDLVSAQMDHVYFPVTMREFGAHVTFRDLREEAFWMDQIKVSTMLLSHPGYCLGYRVDYKEKSVCYITDNELYLNESPSHNPHYETGLAAFVSGCDYLITDSTYTDEEYESKVGWGHSCVSKVVELAHAGRVKHLCLFHHDPDQDDDAIDAKFETASADLAELKSSTICLAPAEGTVFKL